MPRSLILVAVVLAGSTAWGQQLSPEQSVAAQLGSQIGVLVHDNRMLQAQLQQAQARIKALEEQVKSAPAPQEKSQ